MNYINDEYCWTHNSPNGGWTCEICREKSSDINRQEPAIQSGECVECGRYSEQLLNGSCEGCVMQAMLDAQQ